MIRNSGLSRRRSSILWIGLFIGVGFYLCDVFVHVYIIHAGTLWQEIFAPTGHELLMRTSVFVVALVFSIYVYRLLGQERATSKRALTAERFLGSVVDNIPDMIFIKDADELRFLRVNRSGEKLLGVSRRELIGKNDYDLFPREQADFFTCKDREVLASGTLVDIPEEEIDTVALGKRWLHTKKVPILDADRQPLYLLGISEDITQARLAEEERRRTELRFQALFNAAAEFIFVLDDEGVILEANRQVYERSGYTEEEIVGTAIRDLLDCESREQYDVCFPVLRERGHARTDVRFAGKDGSVIDMECSATGVPDEAGNFGNFLVIQRDVTERKRQAEALANSERRFRVIFNSTFQLIGVLDPAGTVLEANQTALDLGGLRKEDVIGKPFWDTGWWSHSREAQQRLKSAIEQAALGKPFRYEEEHIRAQDGVTRTIDFTLKPVLNEQGEVAFIIPEGRDITDARRTEKEKQRQQEEMAHVMRLSTMGEMASGMAHELNQPLTALVGYCSTAIELAKETPNLPEGYLDILERAAEQAHRAGDVIRHLREHVSRGSSVRSTVLLDELIEGVIDFVSWELRDSDIGIEFTGRSPACEVQIDKVQIEQVLINLLRNSIESIRAGGVTGGRIEVASRETGSGEVEVCVLDNGPGIAPELVDTLFEPYQTSKETGMGMGLSISRSIAEAHDGRLWADPDRKQGARFCLGIPGRG